MPAMTHADRTLRTFREIARLRTQLRTARAPDTRAAITEQIEVLKSRWLKRFKARQNEARK